MNDFTKEELKELHYCVAHYSNCKFTYPENIELEKKLKSMVDNYCEHSWVYYFSHEGSYVFCQKCEKRL